MKVRRRGFMASLAALVAGGMAAREAAKAPLQLADSEYMRVDTGDGGNVVIRGGSGGGVGFYGAQPVSVGSSKKLTEIIDDMKKLGLFA